MKVNSKDLSTVQLGMVDIHECLLSLRRIQKLEGQAVVLWEIRMLRDRMFRLMMTIGQMVSSVDEGATLFERRLGVHCSSLITTLIFQLWHQTQSQTLIFQLCHQAWKILRKF